VFKTHIDIVADFGDETVQGLQRLAEKHNFLIFEDRKFVDIGNTVQKQYHGGALRISEWAHFINASVLAGDGIIEALSATGTSKAFQYRGDRGLLILAEMTTEGSLAVGEYTEASIWSAKKHTDFVVGFVATRALTDVADKSGSEGSEDFVIFTTGVNRSSKGDKLGQRYQTPDSAIKRGADFIIAGRGIYAAEDPAASARLYQEEGWNAYLARIA
jgi:orotidine-5'-phosphate decarboxylase